jgi:hypothetical protein
MWRQHTIAVNRIAEPVGDQVNRRTRLKHQLEAMQLLSRITPRVQSHLANCLAYGLGIGKDRFMFDMEFQILYLSYANAGA